MTYRMTADDAYRVSRMLMPRWFSIGIGVGAVLILIGGAVLAVSGEVGLGVGLVGGALFLLASRPIVRWVTMRRVSTRLAKVPEPIVVTIGADGIRGSRGQSSSLVGWGDVTSVDVRGPFVWVQGRVSPVFAIPLRAFSGDAEIQGFVTAANGFLASSTPT